MPTMGALAHYLLAGMTFGILPLATAFFAYGFAVRKKDPATARASGLSFATTIITVLLGHAMAWFMSWYFEVREAILTAIENGTSWSPEDYIAAPVLALSAYWWVPALVMVLLSVVMFVWPQKNAAK